jgi:GntR family transcriptional regulator/MocR family aminotransferase
MTEQSDLLLTNPPSGGIMLLRQAIAAHLYQFRGMEVSAEQIIIGAGTEYLYSLIIQLLGRDKIFAAENPSYPKISKVYESNNVQCRYLPLDNNGVSIDYLKKSDTDVLHISPSHHYPTGIVTPVSRRHEILEWAYEKDTRYIIEDDYDCEFRMVGRPIPTLQSIDACDRVIYMNTFTKSLASTIRISYMVLPKSLVEKFYKNLGFYSCTVSTFEQLTLYKFISEGYFEKHINRMRNFYKNHRNLILNAIKSSPLNNICTIREQNAGLHFLLSVDTPLSEDEIRERAKKLGIRIGFLSEFFHDTSYAHPDISHTLVMNYSGIEAEKIPYGIELLAKCIIK